VDKLTWIAGKCPMGCGDSLFVGAGGHITCSWIECPNPSAADELGTNPLCERPGFQNAGLAPRERR
jgi:hypothetical protein